MKFKDSKYKNIYLFADFETYGLSYFLKNGYTKIYACYLKSKELEYELFDVDVDNFLNELFYKIKNQEFTKEKVNYMIYFHNGSGFDYHFILPKLYDFFSTKNISTFWFKNKDIYYIKIKIIKKQNKKRKVISYITFACSYLIFRTSIDKMGKSLGFKKIENYDYDMQDEFKTNNDFINHQNGLSYKYLKRDVEILEKFFYTDKGINYDNFNLTNGSTAMNFLYNINPELKDQSKWLRKKNDLLYTINLWNILKTAHHGGFCYVNPIYQLKLLHNVKVYDVNSLYAAVMKNKKLPYGYPVFYKSVTHTYEFYYVLIKEVKTDRTPFFSDKDRLKDYIKLKEKYFQEKSLEKNKDRINLIDTSDVLDEKYTNILKNQVLLMDSYQLEYFKKHYQGKYEIKFYCAFKEKTGMFTEYIKHWEKLKIDFEKAGNMVGRQFAKEQAILPNGKFGQTIYNKRTDMFKVEDLKSHLIKLEKKNPLFYFKYIKLEKGEYIMQYSKDDNKEYNRAKLRRLGDLYHYSLFIDINSSPNFLPIAISILSQARIILFELINLYPDKFIYADTDSVHLLNQEIEKKYIDKYEFGKWKYEGHFINAVYRRPKHYLHIGQIQNNIEDKDFYEIKGGGFNVSYFNKTKSITLNDYLKEEFEVNGGKRTKILTQSGIVLAEINYQFKMPTFYYENKKREIVNKKIEKK